MAEIIISGGVVSSGIVVGENTQLIVESGGTVSAAFVSSFDCGPIVVESGGLAVSTVIEDGAVLRISGTANNTTATNTGSAVLFDGGVASNTTVDDCGSLEISGGVAVSTTVENDGEVYIYGGIASNTIVNDGELVVYEEAFADTAIIGSDGEIYVYGFAADITVNGGEMFISYGGIVNGLTVSSTTMIYIDSGSKLTGQITLDSSPVTLSEDGILDFDISAQAPGSAALLNNYSLVAAESGSVFTITVDANQTEGTYALAGGVTMFGGSLTVGTTGTVYGSVDLDDPLVYGDYTYTLTLTEGALDLTIAAGGGEVPTSSGAVISDGTYPVSSGEFWLDTTINSGGSLIVSNGGRADSTIVNSNGWLNVYPEGTAMAIVENGGYVDLLEQGSATFASNTISGINFESAPATVHSGTTAVDITLNEWGTMQVFDGGVVNSVTVNPNGELTLLSGGTALNIIENGGGVQLVKIEPGDSATMTFLPNTFSGAVADNGRIITAHSGTTAVDVTVSSWAGMEVYSGGVLRGLTIGSNGNAVIQPGAKLTGPVTLDSNLEGLLLTPNAILDFDISAQSPNSTPLLNDYSLITIWGTASPIYTITVSSEQAEGTYALAAGAAAFTGSLTLGTADTEYGTISVDTPLEYGDYTYTLTLTDGALDLDVASSGSVVPTSSGAVISDGVYNVSSGEIWLDTTVNSSGWLNVSEGGIVDSATVNPKGQINISSGGSAVNIIENGGFVEINEGASVAFLPNTVSGVTVDEYFAAMTVHSGTTAVDTTLSDEGSLHVFDGGVASNVTVNTEGTVYINGGGKVTGKMTLSDEINGFYLFDGAILDFDISTQAPGSDPLLNNFYLIIVGEEEEPAVPVYTITVDPEQAEGTYALADYVDEFPALTLGTADTVYGTVSVDTPLVHGGYTYTLTLNDVLLELTVTHGGGQPTSSGVIIHENESASVNSGETWLDTTIEYAGALTVNEGGLASSTTAGGDMWVKGGGSADIVTVNPGGRIFVSSGGIATDIKENGGYVSIGEGGSANIVENTFSGATISSFKTATVHSGTTAAYTTLTDGGAMEVYDGGVASNIVLLSSGFVPTRLVVYSGGKVTGSMYMDVPNVQVAMSSGAILDFDISGQAPGAGALVNDLGYIIGSPNYTITVDALQAPGTYTLAAGAEDFWGTFTLGTADTEYGAITVNGNALVYGDYTFTLTVSEEFLNLAVEGPEPPISGMVLIDSSYDVTSGVTLLDTQVSSGGSLTVSSGGLADITTVNHHGSMFVANGGTATNIIENGGYVRINEGGSANFLPNTFSGMSNDNATWTTVHSGTVALDTTIGYFGALNVYDGGVARDFSFTANYSYLYAYGGKITGSMTITPDVFTTIYLYEGSIMDFDVSGQTTESSALVNNLNKFFVIQSNKPTLTITVSSEQAGGKYALAEGAEGFEGTFTLGTADTEYGTITVNGDALVYGDYTYALTLVDGSLGLTVTPLPVSGMILIDSTYNVSSGRTVLDTQVSSGGVLRVFSGGLADITTVNPDGAMYVSSGGTGTTIVENGGYVEIKEGASATFVENTFSGLTLTGAFATVHSGTTAQDTTIESNGRLIVSEGGVAEETLVNVGGAMYVSSGGTATEIVENGGYVSVDDNASATFVENTFSGLTLTGAPAALHSGTTAVDTIIGSSAYLHVYGGGVANGVTTTDDGYMVLFDGGKVTGSMNLSSENDTGILAANGVIDFDITEQSPNSTALLNDYSKIMDPFGYTQYTVTVDASQKPGTYALAENAGDFDKSVTIGTADLEYGTLTVNGDTLSYEGFDYTLTLDDTTLNLTIETSVYEVSGDTSETQPVPLQYPGKFVLDGIYGNITGSVNIYNGGKKIASGSLKKGKLRFTKKPILLDSNLGTDFQIKIKKGNDPEYTATFTPVVLYTKGNNADDTPATAQEVGVIEEAGPITTDWVGFSDQFDYYSFSLDHAAKLSLDYTATDKVKFRIFDAVTGKTIQTAFVKAGKPLTKSKQLEAGSYYLEVESRNAKKGGDADYTINVNDDTIFYTKGYNGDDTPETAISLGEVTEPGNLVTDWVGAGDEFDYRTITLNSAAKLNFQIVSYDKVKFTVYQQNAKGKLKSIGSFSLNGGIANTKDIFVEEGTYYLSMQSKNAKKGGDADYWVKVADTSRFFTDGDNTNDTWQAVSEKSPVSEGEEFSGWVGFGDSIDFTKFEVAENGRIRLTLNDEETALALANKEIKLKCLDENGKSVAIAVDKKNPFTVISKKDVFAGNYYLGVECTNVKKYDTYYSITNGGLLAAV